MDAEQSKSVELSIQIHRRLSKLVKKWDGIITEQRLGVDNISFQSGRLSSDQSSSEIHSLRTFVVGSNVESLEYYRELRDLVSDMLSQTGEDFHWNGHLSINSSGVEGMGSSVSIVLGFGENSIDTSGFTEERVAKVASVTLDQIEERVEFGMYYGFREPVVDSAVTTSLQVTGEHTEMGESLKVIHSPLRLLFPKMTPRTAVLSTFDQSERERILQTIEPSRDYIARQLQTLNSEFDQSDIEDLVIEITSGLRNNGIVNGAYVSALELIYGMPEVIKSHKLSADKDSLEILCASLFVFLVDKNHRFQHLSVWSILTTDTIEDMSPSLFADRSFALEQRRRIVYDVLMRAGLGTYTKGLMSPRLGYAREALREGSPGYLAVLFGAFLPSPIISIACRRALREAKLMIPGEGVGKNLLPSGEGLSAIVEV
ncbi:MAG TPA: hypothetical protein ENI23_02750 [bacterium]|nr:hypothetical protein [bacterium]